MRDLTSLLYWLGFAYFALLTISSAVTSKPYWTIFFGGLWIYYAMAHVDRK